VRCIRCQAASQASWLTASLCLCLCLCVCWCLWARCELAPQPCLAGWCVAGSGFVSERSAWSPPGQLASYWQPCRLCVLYLSSWQDRALPQLWCLRRVLLHVSTELSSSSLSCHADLSAVGSAQGPSVLNACRPAYTQCHGLHAPDSGCCSAGALMIRVSLRGSTA